MEQKMRKNILFSHWVKMLRSSMLMIAILVPFFNEFGLSQYEVGVLQAVFFIVVMLFEAPSGYAADMLGRKKTMLVGAWFALAGMAMYTITSDFNGFLAVEVLLGIGLAMFSGADESLVYDSYLYLGEEDEFLEFRARSGLYTGIAEMAASLVGGSVLALYSLRYPFYGQIVIELALIYCVLQLTEPPRTKLVSKGAVKDMKSIALSCFNDTKLKWLIAYNAIAANLTHTLVWLIQPMYSKAGIELRYFGVVWAFSMLVAAISSKFSTKYQKLLGRNIALICTLVVGVASYLVLGWRVSMATMPILFLFSIVRGLTLPILSTYINDLTDSSVRATTNSLASFVKALVYIPMVTLVGYFADVYSLEFSMMFSGVFYGLLGFIVVIFARSSNKT